jgi:NADH-quinone oxidoreductase subunit N
MKSMLFLNFSYIIPELFLIFLIFYSFVIFLFLSSTRLFKFPLLNTASLWVILFGLFILLIISLKTPNVNISFFNNLLYYNYLIKFSKIIIIFLTIISIVVSFQYLLDEKINDFEYIISFLFVLLGIFFFLLSFDFIVLFISLEIQSLTLYFLVTSRNRSLFSTEAGLKYFILGSLSSIFILFSFSLIYFILGTTNFGEISQLVAVNSVTLNYDVLLFCSIFFLFVGFFFKIAAAPFHFWAPDVYEGAQTSVSLFMSLVPKFSFLVVLIKLLYFVFNFLFLKFQVLLFIVSFLSIFCGAFFGLRQQKLKRLFIFSSIGNIGFILFGITSGTLEGLQFVFVYILIYLLMSIILWVSYISLRFLKTNSVLIYLSDLSSLIITNPLFISIFVLNFFSIAGIPPLLGFWSKFLIFMSSLDFGFIFFSVLILFLNMVSVFYYLRLIKLIYFNINNLIILYFKAIPRINANILSFFIILLFFFIIFPDFLLLFAYKLAHNVI